MEVLVWSAATKYDRYVFSVPHAAIQRVRPHAQQSPSPSSLTPALFQETLLRTLMRGQPALATLSYDFVLKFDPCADMMGRKEKRLPRRNKDAVLVRRPLKARP